MFSKYGEYSVNVKTKLLTAVGAVSFSIKMFNFGCLNTHLILFRGYDPQNFCCPKA